MKKKIYIIALGFASLPFFGQKILFDATKGEMAGNADWVIDADLHNLSVTTAGTEVLGGSDSNPQRIPTPAQSGITASTSETYWTGGLSAWGIDLAKLGYTLETLPYNGKITYGDATNVQDLSNYKVYIVDEPNIKFTTAESAAIVNFVKNGGGLFMISDHTVSDRNNDGWDSPAIWNDLLANNGVAANPFGITFDLKNISGTYTNVATLPGNAILHGSAGNPTEIQLSNGTTMTLDRTKNNTATGLMFTTGSSTTGTTNSLFSTATYGTGKVCAMGDSSIPDDGTGDSGDSLYNGYTGDAAGNHRPLLINAVVWLAGSASLGTQETAADQTIGIYPNPVSDILNIKGSLPANTVAEITDMSGKHLYSTAVATNTLNVAALPKGLYFLKLGHAGTFKFIKK